MENLIYDCVVIGSGPAGLTGAIYMARAGYKTAVISDEIGGTLNKIYQLENYPGFTGPGYKLVENMVAQCEQLNIEFIFDNIHHVNKYVTNNGVIYKIYNKENEDEVVPYMAKTVIEAVGTLPNKLNIPSENELLNKKIHFCAMCDGNFYKNKDVVIIGGGNSAFDSALYLSTICNSVTIIHRRDQFRAENYLVEKAKNKKNIYFILNSIIDEFKLEDNKISILYNQGEKFICDGVFYSLGFSTNNIDKYFNLKEGYFKAGDCSTSPENHQAIIAAADGAKTAIQCIAYLK